MLLMLLVTSISLDFNDLIDMAFQIINALWPLFVVLVLATMLVNNAWDISDCSGTCAISGLE